MLACVTGAGSGKHLLELVQLAQLEPSRYWEVERQVELEGLECMVGARLGA